MTDLSLPSPTRLTGFGDSGLGFGIGILAWMLSRESKCAIALPIRRVRKSQVWVHEVHEVQEC